MLRWWGDFIWLDGGNCLSSGIRHVKSGMVMDRKR